MYLSVTVGGRLGDAHRLFDQQHARYATLYSAAIRTWNVSRQEALAVVAEAIETHKVAHFLCPLCCTLCLTTSRESRT